MSAGRAVNLVSRVVALKAGVAAARWLLALAIGHLALVALAVVVLAVPDKSDAGGDSAAAAYRVFDQRLLRTLTRRALAGEQQAGLAALWAARPPYPPPAAALAGAGGADFGEARARVMGKVPTDLDRALRGLRDVLPFQLAALALTLLAAALAGALGAWPAWAASRLHRAGGALLALLFVVWPALTAIDPAPFHQRAVSLGLGFGAVLFVAGFAAVLPRVAARHLATDLPPARFAQQIGGPGWLVGARLAVVGACDSLVPAVPAVTAAALFVRAKAHQDSLLRDNGLGRLVNSALTLANQPPRHYVAAFAATALALGALLVLTYLGYRFLAELRWVLSSETPAAREQP